MISPVTKQQLLVRHAVPGRLRIHVPWIYRSPERAAVLQQWMITRPGVKKAVARSSTGSVVVSYHEHITGPDALISLLERISYREVLDTNVAIPEHPQTSGLRGTYSVSKGRLFELAALGGVVIYGLIRSTVFRVPFHHGILSPVAGLTLILALPVVRRAVADIRQGRRASSNQFLVGTSAIAIVMGEVLTALEVIAILRLGTLLEGYVEDKSRRALREALQVAPDYAYMYVDGSEIQVPVIEVEAGAIVVVRADEKIPVDGAVAEGEALVDESFINGRWEPELRQSGDRVYAGTKVQQGKIFIRTEKAGDATYISSILKVVEESLLNRAPVEKRADLLATRLLRMAVPLTVGTFVVTGSVARALTVLLVMGCPCAIVLAASTAVSAGLTNAARRSIFVKGGFYLERMSQTNCFCFDKTGTLTGGEPTITEIVPRMPNISEERIIELAATAEAHSTHPMAKALVKAAEQRGIMPTLNAVPKYVVGRGVQARLDEDTILVGNREFMETKGIATTYFQTRANSLMEKGRTIIYVARNGKLQGLIGATSGVRPEAKDVLAWLRQNGVASIHVLTGDTQQTTGFITETLDLDGCAADLLPEDKAHYVRDLVKQGWIVTVIGDGINDTVAFSQSNVGVALATRGAEVAIEAADISIINGELRGLITTRQISRKTLKVIEQNYWLAVGTDILGIVLSAAGFLSPVGSGMLHIAHTLGIMLNSSSLMIWEPPGFRSHIIAQ